MTAVSLASYSHESLELTAAVVIGGRRTTKLQYFEAHLVA